MEPKNLEFKINRLITLKLEGNETIIYVENKRFRQCKYLFLINPYELDEIRSIDDISESLNGNLELDIIPEELGITPEQEFLGHCSNLQAWVEHNYDTRLLHSNLAFPLLKKLMDAGDIEASKIFKKELINRYIEGSSNTRKFILYEYNNDFTLEEKLFILEEIAKKKGEYLDILNSVLSDLENKWLYENDSYSRRKLKDLVINFFSKGDEFTRKLLSPRFLFTHALLLDEDGDEYEDYLFDKRELLILYNGILKENDYSIFIDICKKMHDNYFFHLNENFKIDEGRIVYLKLFGHWFKNWPNEVLELKNLKFLELNNFGKIENEISNSNQISPTSLGSLTDLRQLIIKGNFSGSKGKSQNQRFRYLDALKNLKNLRYLDLSFNPIMELTDFLLNFTKLEFLFLNGCNLRKIPNGIKKLKNLRILDLNNNFLKEIPYTIQNLPLEVLYLSFNEMEQFPNHVFKIPSLYKVSFDKRLSPKIPENFERASPGTVKRRGQISKDYSVGEIKFRIY